MIVIRFFFNPDRTSTLVRFLLIWRHFLLFPQILHSLTHEFVNWNQANIEIIYLILNSWKQQTRLENVKIRI